MTDTWNPAQYDKFQREREQPFFDLLALVRPGPGMRVVDLGCGTGKLTRTLHERLEARETLGIDRSDSMLAGVRAGAQPPGLHFEVGTIESFVTNTSSPNNYDLIFSNAALHWVDDHERLLGQLAAALAPSGQLAFQVPAQHDALSHLVAEELTDVEPFRSAFGGWHRRQPVLAPEAYARLLYRYGFADPKVQLIVYPHVLASRDTVVEWVKGTLLTEYARHLPPELFDRFVDEYRTRLLARLEDARPASALDDSMRASARLAEAPEARRRPFFYPFTRILCWGQRA